MARSVDREIRRRGLLDPDERILVAVSGGPDSVALLDLLAQWRRRQRPAASAGAIAVAHLDHGARGAAGARDLLFSAALARSLGIEPFVGRRAAARETNEAAWRRERFSFLHGIRGAWRADVVALGHHRDDQAETVLQRLARGAGLAALGGMRWRRADGVVRPLLGLSRQQVGGYLAARSLPRVEDRSNRDRAHLRNRLRLDVLPGLHRALGVDVGARLARLAEDLQRAALQRRAVEGRRVAGPGEPALFLAGVRAAGERAGDVVHDWLRQLDRSVSARQVLAIVELARGRRPSGWVDLGGGERIERVYERLVLAHHAGTGAVAAAGPGDPAFLIDLALGQEGDWGIRWRVGADALAAAAPPEAHPARGRADLSAANSFGGASFYARVPAAAVAHGVRVRTRASGERLQRASGRRKVSDLMIDARLPMRERSGWPIFAIGEGPIWIPGVALAWFSEENRGALENGPTVLLHAKRLDLPVPGCCDSRQLLGVTCRDQD